MVLARTAMQGLRVNTRDIFRGTKGKVLVPTNLQALCMKENGICKAELEGVY